MVHCAGKIFFSSSPLVNVFWHPTTDITTRSILWCLESTESVFLPEVRPDLTRENHDAPVVSVVGWGASHRLGAFGTSNGDDVGVTLSQPNSHLSPAFLTRLSAAADFLNPECTTPHRIINIFFSEVRDPRTPAAWRETHTTPTPVPLRPNLVPLRLATALAKPALPKPRPFLPRF